jgi:hypothetical protein
MIGIAEHAVLAPNATSQRKRSKRRTTRLNASSGVHAGIGALLWLVASPAAAQSETPEGTGEVRKAAPSSVLVAHPTGLSRTIVSFDVASGGAFDGEVKGSSGSMSSSSVYGRLAVSFPVGERLTLSFPLDAAVTYYDFSGGDPLLVPGGGKPWDQVRAFSFGTQARYRFDDHWALIGGANIASAGARGASFADTLSGGGTLGFTYSFSRALTVGVILTAQSQLGGGLFVLPFPVIDWVLPFDNALWRLTAGVLRAGPGRAAGAGIIYAPSQSLAFNAGIALLGLGREFRLASSSPITNGVGRDSSFPLILGAEWRPVRPVAISAYGGVSMFRAVTVLDSSGSTVNERDVKPSPVVGGRIAVAF